MSNDVSPVAATGDLKSAISESIGGNETNESGRESFIELHWEGKRFSHTQFPVSVARELGIVESAIKSLARELWLKNSTKKRVPNGFFNQFNLFLDDLRDGCVNTVLVAGPVEDTQSALFPKEFEKEFDEALDIFLRVIAGEASREEVSEFQSLDETLSFGKALEGGEEVTLVNQRGDSSKEVIFTQKQRAIIRDKYGAQDETSNKPVFGWVSNIDEKGDVIISTYSGESVRITEDTEAETWKRFKQWLAGTRAFISLRIDGEFLVDSHKRVKRAERIDSVDLAYPQEWHDRVVQLMSLSTGWMGANEGAEISTLARRILDGILTYFYEEEFLSDKRPGIYPLIRGGLQLEWDSSDVDWAIEIDNDGTVELSAFGPNADLDEEVSSSSHSQKTSTSVIAKLLKMHLEIEGK